MSNEATTAQRVDARRTDTRQRILDVAAAQFAARGFAGTSIRDIADALGVTKAALYYHFASKEEILQALVDLPISQIRDVLTENHDLSTPEARRAFIHGVIYAMAQCSREVVAVFKDPQLQSQVGVEVKSSGITNVLALELAKGLSGTDDPERVDPEHLVRASAAVAAGEAVLNSWHVVYDSSEKLSPENVDYVTDIVTRTLEV
jgi:AcrR family transcriptional regulator